VGVLSSFGMLSSGAATFCSILVGSLTAAT
jgi:hypothetical protein